jgi:hypothetical protein
MYKKIFFFLFLALVSRATFAQQWSQADSVWLRNFLEGGAIEVNEDTQRAIREGQLIVPSWMKKNDADGLKSIELLKDPENVSAVPDSFHIRNVDPYSMPPAVFALYVLYINKVDSLSETMTCMLTTEEKAKLEELLPAGTAQALSLRTSDDTPGATLSTDFNYLLATLFSPLYRRRMYNARHATAYKNYYDAGVMPASRFTEREKRQLRQAVNALKISTIIHDPAIKRNGIDH